MNLIARLTYILCETRKGSRANAPGRLRSVDISHMCYINLQHLAFTRYLKSLENIESCDLSFNIITSIPKSQIMRHHSL